MSLNREQKKEVEALMTISSQEKNDKKGHRGRFRKRDCEKMRYPSLIGKEPIQRQGSRSKQEVYEEAWRLMEQDRKTCTAAEASFSDIEKEMIYAKLLPIKQAGGDYLAAIDAGWKSSRNKTGFEHIPLADFWKDYVTSKIKNRDWKRQNTITANDRIWRLEKDRLFKQPLGIFTDAVTGRGQIKAFLERHKCKWKARKSALSALSYIRGFLTYIKAKTDAGGTLLNKALINEVCDYEAVLPEGLEPEQPNRAATLAQICSLIDALSHGLYRTNNRGREVQPKAAEIILKCFMGARSELVHLWNWSIWNRETGRITIPKEMTKMKTHNQVFKVSEIPFLEEWLWWAWEIDGRPSDDQPICRSGRGETERLSKKWMNMNKHIFSVSHENRLYDLETEIKPAKTHRNHIRSAFITYAQTMTGLGAESMEITRASIVTIAEDKHCWDSYVDPNADQESAKRFFELTPDNYKQILKEEIDKIEEY
ncbi:MAG: hypothetical protein ABGY95_04985, partial [Rubritalea sp.]|uniref:hypothetical protein n=1 Tax=Rubritalea sp. TaxID=2109375 RepID=UPI0032428A52